MRQKSTLQAQFKDILEKISKATGVPEQEIVASNGRTLAVDVRSMLIELLCTKTEATRLDIARLLGVSPYTVRYHRRRHVQSLKYYSTYRRLWYTVKW